MPVRDLEVMQLFFPPQIAALEAQGFQVALQRGKRRTQVVRNVSYNFV